MVARPGDTSLIAAPAAAVVKPFSDRFFHREEFVLSAFFTLHAEIGST